MVIVTTSYKPQDALIEKAGEVAETLNTAYIPRYKRSIRSLHADFDVEDVVVVSGKELKVYRQGHSDPFHFHPDLSYLRIKRMRNGEHDSMATICGLQPGDRFLDCTLGMGSDSIVASYVVGHRGEVVGLESELLLSVIVEQGLQMRQTRLQAVNDAMRRIEVRHAAHAEFLKHCSDDAYDVIYFDPMFRRPLQKSESISSLRRYVNPEALQTDIVREAYRVTRRCVVLKERSDSNEFQRLGFAKQFRVNASTSYGVMMKNADS